ncbi:MAG: family 78 glycoside hydrolase catalytic domain [Christensenellales bacterium]
MEIYGLSTEYQSPPLGVESPHPRFGWKLRGRSRQTGYALRVWEADTGRKVWDTGRVSGKKSLHVPYAGEALRPLTAYRWQVEVTAGEEKALSPEGFFTTSRLDTPWEAQWITAPRAVVPDPWAVPAFRREFVCSETPSRAVLTVTARGWYHAVLDGRELSEQMFAPGWHDPRRLTYQCLEVSLTEGAHVLGLMLGKGWDNGDFFGNFGRDDLGGQQARFPSVLAELHIFYPDGRKEVLSTDTSWRCAPTAVIHAHLYMGERVDARLWQPGWDLPGFAGDWAAAEIAEPCALPLTGAEAPAAKRQFALRPLALFTTPKGEKVVDMGQNMVGVLDLSVDARAGDEISLRFFEVLDKEGNVYLDNMRAARAALDYTCAEGRQTYSSRFTHFGFRYIYLEKWPESLPFTAESFTGQVVFADMERTGWFDCSREDVNRFFENTVWGQRGNFVDVPTDCPQRDERLGWTGDAQVFCRTAAFIYGVDAFFTKWLRDMALEQAPNGAVGFVVPNVLADLDAEDWMEQSRGSAAWGDAATICPWTIYRVYGDERLLAESYPMMKKWVHYIRDTGDDPYRWNTGFHFGDWLSLGARDNNSIGTTDPYLIAQAMYVFSARITAAAARVLGLKDDAREMDKLAEGAVKAFRREYITPLGRVAVPTQTALLLTLKLGLCKKKHRHRVLEDLCALIHESKDHLATGFVGTPYLLHVLTENGRHDLAAKVFLQESFPGWLYPVHRGATTVWERWDGIKPDGSFQDAGMNSFNHYAYGSVCDWLVEKVAGLDMAEKEPGYRVLRLHPRRTGSLTHARAELETVRGRVSCGWKREDGRMEVSVEIPAGSTAELTLEGLRTAAALEQPADFPAKLGKEGLILKLRPGAYTFRYRPEV